MLKNHYTSQQIVLNSDKNFGDNFFLNSYSYLLLILSLTSVQTSLTDTIILLKVLVMTIQANNRKKESLPQKKLTLLKWSILTYNWELNTFHDPEQKFNAPVFMLNCFVVSWIISCSMRVSFLKPVQTQYIIKAQQKLKQKHHHCSKSLQALPFPLKVPFSKEQPTTCTSETST